MITLYLSDAVYAGYKSAFIFKVCTVWGTMLVRLRSSVKKDLDKGI